MISDFRVTVKADLGDGTTREMDVRELEGPYITTQPGPEGMVETVEYRLNGRVVHRSVGILPPKH